VRIPIFSLLTKALPRTVAWLKPLGDEKAEDPFRPCQEPHQSDGLLTEVWREQGYEVFEVHHAAFNISLGALSQYRIPFARD